jgi:hypothetical protein
MEKAEKRLRRVHAAIIKTKRVLMAKKKRPQQKRKTKKRRRISDSQTNQPFERDSKHRIGQYGGAGEPPLMKK